MHTRQQSRITRKIGHAKRRQTSLASPQQLARTSQFQVLFGNDETIVGLTHGFQPLPRHRRQRRLVHQHATGSSRTAPDPTTQLVQLGQPETFGV